MSSVMRSLALLFSLRAGLAGAFQLGLLHGGQVAGCVCPVQPGHADGSPCHVTGFRSSLELDTCQASALRASSWGLGQCVAYPPSWKGTCRLGFCLHVTAEI